MPTVRPYCDADLPALKNLVAHLHESMRPFDEYLAPVAEILDTYFTYLLDTSRNSSGTFFIAEGNGRAIGYLCLFGLLPPSEPDQQPDRYAVIADIYVRPDSRARGVGKALMNAAEAYARGIGAAKMELSVLAGNREAIEFYRRLEYRERIRVYTKKL